MSMNPANQLSAAILLAAVTHENQYDKAGKPYILHPLFLMNQLLFDTELAVIAVLHDVIEDSKGKIDINQLSELGFSYRVTRAVNCLTHYPNETYAQYIDKVCLNYDAIRVKRKDIDHNSRTTRLKGLTDKDFRRIEKYHKAFVKLGNAKDNFNEN